MCLVCGDGHHARFVDDDAVALAQAAAVSLGMSKVLNLLVTYANHLLGVVDCLRHHLVVDVCCLHNFVALFILLLPVLSVTI